MIVGLIWAIIVVSAPGQEMGFWEAKCFADGGTRLAVHTIQVPLAEGGRQKLPFAWCWNDEGEER